MTAMYFLSTLRSKIPYRKFIADYAKRNFKFRAVSTVSNTGFDNYELERKTFSLKIPEKFNFASDVIDIWAKKEKEGTRDASNPAFWYVSDEGHEVKWDFQTLAEESKKTANVLQQVCGLKRGDNLLVMLPKIPEFWLANVAAIRAGILISPCSMMLTVKDVIHRLSIFRPSCIIAHESVAEIIDEAAKSIPCLKIKVIVSDTPGKNVKNSWQDFQQLQQAASADHKCIETSSDENMMVFFTSGTSGLPKMAEHTHASYGLGHSLTGKYMLDLTTETMLWNLSDTGWSMNAYAMFGAWSHGSAIFIHRLSRMTPSVLLQTLSKYPITSFCSAPLVYKAMLLDNVASYKFSKLNHCISGGEPLDPEINKKWKAVTGLNIHSGYGQTETVMSLGMFKCLKFVPGSAGKPPPGIDAVVLDENENEVGPEIEGELALKKKDGHIFGLFKGYKNNPEKTKQVITEKYYHTGDNVYYDKDGYFWFVGRKDDIINSAGYRIGPYEVENALLEHPAVMEVATTSSPDPERGEVVKAFIVLKEAYLDKSQPELIKELQEHAKRTTAPYKYPRKIEFVKELPKTISGKIKRYELRNKEWKKS